MYKTLQPLLQRELQSIHDAGLYKKERVIITPQGAVIKTSDGKEVVNFCANNYLGLSSHPRVIEAAKRAIDTHGFGMSSVRFICGTQDIHKILEKKISHFLSMDDTILYAAAFDANGGVFEPLLGAEDAIISDELNHASIIDGVRLCKAMRYRYKHNDMVDLQKQLEDAREAGAKQILIADDEPDILEILQFNLHAEGYEIITAKNGDEAIEKAKKTEPDLIILDMMMPGKNGIEVCNLLRMMPAFKSTLIIFLTAMSDESTEIKGLETGADDYLTKPFHLSELAARISAMLKL